MPEYNGNNVYLSMNGIDVESLWRGAELTLNIGDENVSAGAGIEWEKHAGKLKNINITVTIIYDDATAAADMASLYAVNDKMPIVYGPEDNTVGKPKHDQDFKINSIAGPSANHDKTLVTLVYTGISTGVPRSNIYAGDTF